MDPDRFEVVSFDSRQVYKFLEIGTAKPDSNLRSHIVHRLIDFLEPGEKISAASFVRLANKEVEDVFSKKKIPIITCGTGFYLKAFLYGMYEIPPANEEIRKKLESLSKDERWNMLKEFDPDAVIKINFNDDYRVIRALETYQLSGKRWSELKERSEDGFISRRDIEIKGIFIEWNRDKLYERINKRAKYIVDNGLLDETKLVAERFGMNCPALNSLGYNFALENIYGSLSLDSLYEKFAQSHRNYAKKQITWFKKEEAIQPLSWNETLDVLKNIERR